MDVGRVTGREIAKNRDGNSNRVLLQVDMIPGNNNDSDVRTVELFSQAGEDINPANGCRVIVLTMPGSYKASVAISDDLQPETDPGGKELYSTDNPVTEKRAKIILNTNGDIELDAFGGGNQKILQSGDIELNGNADYAVSWTDLNTILQALITSINALFATKLDGSGTAGTLILDLSPARVDNVRLP
jgi:hypothetical protein